MSKNETLRNLLILALLIFIVAAIIYSIVYIPPFKTLEQIKLVMRDVDVTLLFGKKPDCPVMDGDANTTMKYQGMGPSEDGEPCHYTISFSKSDDGVYRVSKICFILVMSEYRPKYSTYMKYEWPKSIWQEDYSVDSKEEALLKTFGEPSYVSIYKDGTFKYISFNKYNAAFLIKSGEVIEACVSNELPIRLLNEYKPQ